ncbi:MAG: endonuclease/exonuclease/phosphatase family protein [Fimbriimonadaceae bacterium]|nr:endonuclease/exonuclease/phosphatase family protein [Fimbriimonadaceae bacterium]
MTGAAAATPLPSRRLQRLTAATIAAWLLLLAVQRLVGEGHWLALTLTYGPQLPLLLPGLLVLLWRLRYPGRQRWLALLLLLATPGLFLDLRLAPLRRSGSPVALRVLTYNTYYGLAGAAAVAALAERCRADLVCLQEVIPPAGGTDPGPAIDAAFAGWHRAAGGELRIFSRWPLREAHYVELPAMPRLFGYLRATLLVGDHPLAVIATHLETAIGRETFEHGLRGYRRDVARWHEFRLQQAAGVLQSAAQVRGPLLIAGDFNTPPRGRLYGQFAARYTDAFAAVGGGTGYTYHRRLPLLRIDYLWSSPELRPLSCRVLPTPGSDHRPVLAEYAWR